MSQSLAKGIEEATTVLASIPDFMKAFSDVMQTPYGWIFLVVILFWFFLNKNLTNIFNFFESKERKRLVGLEAYVNNPQVADGEALEVIKDLRDACYFKVATGIYAEKNLRDSLISLRKKISDEISWVNIKRAMPYIKVGQNSSIEIREENLSEKLGYYYNLVVGWLFLGSSVLLWLMFLFTENKGFNHVFVCVFSVLFCLFVSVLVFSQNFSIVSASKIRKKLLLLNRLEYTDEMIAKNDSKLKG